MAPVLFVGELWLATVLWTAMVVAWYARRRAPWRLALALTATVVALIPWLLGLCLIAAFHLSNPWDSLGFYLAVSTFVTLLVAMIVIWWRGLRRIPELNLARAAAWPLGRLAISAAVAVILAQTTLWMFDSQLREQLIDLRREAQVLAQSVSPQSVPDAENAAPLYHQVMDAMGAHYLQPPDKRNVNEINEDENNRSKLDAAPEEPDVPDFRGHYWIDVVEQLGEESLPRYDFTSPRLKAFLERHHGVRELLVRAGRLPACNFGRDFTRVSYDMLLPEIQEMRAIVRYLAVDARQAAAMGDGLRAAEDLETIYRASEHVAQEPFLVCELVAIATEGTANQTLRDILNHTLDPPAELLALKFPPQMPTLNVIDLDLRLEEAIGMTMVSQLNTDLEQIQVLQPLSEKIKLMLAVYSAPFVRAFFLNATATDLRETYRELRRQIAELSSPSKENLDKFNDFDAKKHTPLVGLLIPAVGACGKAALRAEAQRRITHTALALFRYYHAPGENGQPRKEFPQSLKDLLPDDIAYLPSDPFTRGQPLRYHLTEHGFLLYSIGPNLRDDGGVQVDDQPDELDYVFAGLAPTAPPEGAE